MTTRVDTQTSSNPAGPLTATAVNTSWLRPDNWPSMAIASPRSAGLPRMRPAQTTAVSEPSVGNALRRLPALAFSRAKRSTYSWGGSSRRGVSSIPTGLTSTATPILASRSRRRGEADARQSTATPCLPCMEITASLMACQATFESTEHGGQPRPEYGTNQGGQQKGEMHRKGAEQTAQPLFDQLNQTQQHQNQECLLHQGVSTKAWIDQSGEEGQQRQRQRIQPQRRTFNKIQQDAKQKTVKNSDPGRRRHAPVDQHQAQPVWPPDLPAFRQWHNLQAQCQGQRKPDPEQGCMGCTRHQSGSSVAVGSMASTVCGSSSSGSSSSQLSSSGTGTGSGGKISRKWRERCKRATGSAVTRAKGCPGSCTTSVTLATG